MSLHLLKQILASFNALISLRLPKMLVKEFAFKNLHRSIVTQSLLSDLQFFKLAITDEI